MNLNEDVQSAVMAKWLADSWLKLTANVAGGLKYEFAPKGTSLPYVVFYLRMRTDRTFGGYCGDYELQFNIFSESAGAGQANGIAEKIKAAYEGATLTYPGGHTAVAAPALRTEEVFFNDSELWQGVLIFDLSVK